MATKRTQMRQIKVADKTSAGNEQQRTYYYPDGRAPVTVKAPSTVTPAANGAHVVLTCAGVTVTVPAGFVRIEPVYRPGYEGAARIEDPLV